MEQSYAVLKWVAAHADEVGGDGSRIAIAGNSVGGDMTAALTLMAKDKKRPESQPPSAFDTRDRCEPGVTTITLSRDIWH